LTDEFLSRFQRPVRKIELRRKTGYLLVQPDIAIDQHIDVVGAGQALRRPCASSAILAGDLPYQRRLTDLDVEAFLPQRLHFIVDGLVHVVGERKRRL
jgi:hypothetical protein